MNRIKEAFSEFEKPSVAIDTVLIRVRDYGESTNRQIAGKKMQVLLISDKNEKENKQWHLPGTILRLGETPDDAINRIVATKTNASRAYYEQLYTMADDINRDDRGHIISIVYIGIVDNNTEIKMLDESKYEAKWAWIDKEVSGSRRFSTDDTVVNTKELKYDHAKIISDTISRLKGKLMYTDIGFKFIEDKFTIRDLENTFVAINERQIPGFRRIIASKIEGTGIMSNGKAYRPAELYKRALKGEIKNE